MSHTSSYHPQTSQMLTSPSSNEYEMGLLDLNSYTRTMRQHTQKQMDVAMKLERRSRPDDAGGNAHGALATEGGVSSIDSTQS
jgi:hypothetical protein